MPATVPAVDRDSYAAFHAGDERALERLFLSKYSSLLEVAKLDLEDPMRAARVVETATLRAWREREHIETPDALDAWLEHAVREGATREKGRVAALHRHEAHDGVRAKHAAHAPHVAPTAEQAWAQVAAALHPTVSAEEALTHRHQEAKHHAAEHMAAVGKERRFPLLALIGLFAAAVAIVTVLFVIPATREDSKISRALGNPNVREVSTRPGQRGTVKLDDGSTVMLGPQSKLTIPPAFPDQMRVVGLDGTAAFEVAPNANASRFIVRAGRAKVVVTGTKFDVASYPAEHGTIVRVREGEVQVASGKDVRTLGRGETAAVSRTGELGAANPALVAATLSWTDGRLAVTDLPMRDLLPLMKRWYDLTIVSTEPSLLERKVTMSASVDSSQAAIDALGRAASVMVEWDGHKWLLRDVAPKTK